MSGAEKKPGADDEAAEEAKKQEAAEKKAKKPAHETGQAAVGSKEPLTKKAGRAWDKLGAPITNYTASAAKGVLGGAWALTGGAIANEGAGVGKEFYKAGARVGHRASEGAAKVREAKFAGKLGAGVRLGNEVATESLLLAPGAVARYVANTPGRLIEDVGNAVNHVLLGFGGKHDKLKKKGKGESESSKPGNEAD